MVNQINGNEDKLLETNEEKGLGLWIDKTVKPLKHVHARRKAQAVNKADHSAWLRPDLPL
jgi:hypothetical protein